MKEPPSPDPGPSLTIWGGGASSRVRARHEEGALVVVWPGADPSALARSGVPTHPVEAVLGDEGLAAVDRAARTWTRLWGRLPLVDGKSFRELATWRDGSLLWLAEGFIREQTAGPRCAGLVETSLRLLEGTKASEVDAQGLPAADTVLLSRACTAHGVLFHGTPPKARPLSPGTSGRRALKALEGLLAPARPPDRPASLGPGAPRDAPPLLVLTDGDDDGRSLRPLLEGASDQLSLPVVVVPTSSLRSWRTRRVTREAREAARRLRELWEALRLAPGVLDSYRHRDVGFSDLAADDLEHLLTGHLPRAVVQLECAVELMGVPPTPAGVIVNVRSRDERRTLLAAAGLAGLPGVALHGHSLTPLETERQDGGPQADLTLVWESGSAPEPLVARLGALVRARVDPE